MAVTIRLRKIGKSVSKKAYFRIGVLDQRKSRDARVIEEIGTYEPAKKTDKFKINMERFKYWESKGAVISPAVRKIVNTLTV